MRKLLTTTALVLTLTLSSVSSVYATTPTTYTEWYGKEGQDESPAYMERALTKLPPEKAADFRGKMTAAHEENKDLYEQIGQLHGELHDILTADTFNKGAFISKRKQIQNLHYKIEENKTEAFASAVSELSKNERIILTRSLHKEHEAKKLHHKAHYHAMKNPPADEPTTPDHQIRNTDK